jgi:hypothetical protein
MRKRRNLIYMTITNLFTYCDTQTAVYTYSRKRMYLLHIYTIYLRIFMAILFVDRFSNVVIPLNKSLMHPTYVSGIHRAVELTYMSTYVQNIPTPYCAFKNKLKHIIYINKNTKIA